MRTKKAIRKACMEKRAALSLPAMHGMLASMVENLLQIPFPQADIAMAYKAIPGKNEVPTEVFEEVLSEERLVKRFCYPAVDFSLNEMKAYLYDEQLIWEDAPFGLLQPRSGTLIPPESIDIVLVPLLAFDENGNRLGYGKGFYDRFLVNCRQETLKIGLSWFEPETLLPEIGIYDVPLNYCITPQRLYVF
jgi:5-formyltetrahydrofolate cyclo-ligase